MKEYSLVFKQSSKKDLENIQENIRLYSGSESEAKYVLRLILKGIDDLKNPYFLGLIPYSSRIAKERFYYYPIVGGSYAVYFTLNKKEGTKTVYYIKPVKTNYENSIFGS